MDIAVVGSGYVGTVVAACFARVGHDVIALEVDQVKLDTLQSGHAPFHEPGLDSLISDGLESGRLRFTGDTADAVQSAELVFFCVGTPPNGDGRPNMDAMEAAARAIGASLDHSCVLVTKSTVPVGSGAWLRRLVMSELRNNGRDDIEVVVASNPEFQREGNAVLDFLHPDRVVIGSADAHALDLLAEAYQPIIRQTFPGGDPVHRPELVCTDLATAETIKYAANAFLATKISFINEVARICDEVGADVTGVATGIGLDARIGASFLSAGVGWGGSCFGKDIDALRVTAHDHGIETAILNAVKSVNERQRALPAVWLERELGGVEDKLIALLGLAFKPNTDDLRDAPSLDIIRDLNALGARIRAYDPAVKDVDGLPVVTVSDPYLAVEDADAVVLVTEWPEFAGLDLGEIRHRMAGNLFLDGRNLLSPEAASAAGLRYQGIGRGVRLDGLG